MISNVIFGTFALALIVWAVYRQPPQSPVRIYEQVRPVGSLEAKQASAQSSTTLLVSSRADSSLEHESSLPMAILNRERARQSGEFHSSFQVFKPKHTKKQPGGDLDDPSTLRNIIDYAAAESEVMLLCIGGEGSMRTGLNLVLNFRAMGLYNMLILTLDEEVCKGLWSVLPQLACVWWPSRLNGPKPNSLYNTMFSKYALAFFEARKVLLERLVMQHRLNVLHLDADTIWFANPYPIFKTLYKDYALIIQTDNPFVNAGVMYVQNVQPGDSAAWVIEELNRRIDRFTYHPESVRQLPNSQWSTPPHFANADEQANLNDIVASALIGRNTFASGVEFYEARFKRDKGSAEARKLMADRSWTYRVQQADIAPARRKLEPLEPDQRYAPIVHLCKMSLWDRVQYAPLRVPGNASAPSARLLLAPNWLFSHFPYGAFFPSFKQCHADSWRWREAAPTEQRLCMPKFRVPTVMVHMSGLRNGQWGRRGVMRALGVWNDKADLVAADAWVSTRSDALLVVDHLFSRSFTSMREFDLLASRALLLGLLLKRRVVIPPLPCDKAWSQKAMEPSHLRALEVGCGPDKQCVWLPMPHFKEAWCSGVDFLYDIDYQELLRRDADARSDVLNITDAVMRERFGAFTRAADSGAAAAAAAAQPALPSLAQRVLRLSPDAAGATPLDWLPVSDFRSHAWKAPFPRLVRQHLEDAPPAGLGLTPPQLRIVRDCMHSLVTSND